jgi:hypothetical protein
MSSAQSSQSVADTPVSGRLEHRRSWWVIFLFQLSSGTTGCFRHSARSRLLALVLWVPFPVLCARH